MNRFEFLLSMNIFNKKAQILSNLQIDVTFQDLEKKIKTSGNSPEIFKTARATLEKMRDKWEPAVLFQWFDFELDEGAASGHIIKNSGEFIHLNLGHSIKFLNQARCVMVSSYTIGQTLDIESANTSSSGSFLEAYMIDLIGLTSLEKTGNIVKKKAEDQARNLGWGVSPFLSPGSVHGWSLKEQPTLCGLLPIEQIKVTIKNDAVLFPFKSICALIGIGPGYDSNEVGSACDVCSKRNKCEMKQEN